VAAVLPVVKDFHHVSAPRPRAWTKTSQLSIPSTSERCTYVRPSPSYRLFPLENVSSTPDQRNDANMRTIRAEEQDLGFVIEINKALFDARTLSGNEKVQNRLPHKDVGQISAHADCGGRVLTSMYFSKHSLGLAPSLVYPRLVWGHLRSGGSSRR